MAHSQTNGFRINTAAGAANHPNKAPYGSKYVNRNRLSLQDASQTPLPPSSPAIRTPRPDFQRTSSTPRPSPIPNLRRSSSSMSLGTDRRSSSPALMRKSSTSSLRGDSQGTPTRLNTRRSSSQLNPNSPLAPAMEEPVITENTVAEDYFKQELARHESLDASVNTIVILHEACYGHRFARPKTTKSMLGLIVERPERIEASTMGISAAYVRLGERHNEGQYGPDPRVRPPGHLPFKIRRTARTLPITSAAVTQVHGVKWMDELKVMCNSTAEKLASTGRETERPVDPTQKDKPAFHSGDLYLCSETLAALEGALGGVCDGVDAVFAGSATGAGPSQAFVCIRPPGHHCSADFPSGFCWLNNVHVGIQHAVKEHQLTHAAIIDFDLHHGDGSQSITWQHNAKVASMPKNTPAIKKTAIGYYSLHDINSYPCENGEPEKIRNASICIEDAHNQSIWNVHLEPWKTEAEFWELYESRYLTILEKARVFLKHHTRRLRSNPNLPKPKGAIFISAGFDASEHEGAGMQRHSVNVPTEFYARFTRDIVALAQEEGTGVDGRVVSVLEGGYSDKALISGVLSHVSGLCHGQHVAAAPVHGSADGLAAEMSRLNVGGLSGVPGAGQLADIDDVAHQLRYNSEWWTSEHLDALVEILNPAAKMPMLDAAKQAARSSAFSSPTQASRMKQVDPAQIRRSSSGVFNRFPGSATPSRPTTPPPPTVHWTVASEELCKLLIPNRQTKSHTATELAVPKIKRERQSSIGLIIAPPLPATRQLREKRTVRATPSIPEEKRIVSRGDRRRTIAANELPSNGTTGPPKPTIDRGRRRSSVASTVSNMSTAPTTTSMPLPRPKLTTNGSGSGSGVQVKKTRTPASKLAIPASTTAKTNGSRSSSGDMDALINKTQKLKIKVPSEEEYAARQRAAAAKKVAEIKKPAEPRKVGRPPKATTVGANAAKKLAPAPSKMKSPVIDSTPHIPSTGAFQVRPAAAGVSAPESRAPMAPMPSAFQTTPAVVPEPSTDLPMYQQAGGHFQPLAPANVFASSAAHTQPPVFSSSGFIPFAQGGQPQQAPPVFNLRPPSQMTGVGVQEEARKQDIWDVSGAPMKENGVGGLRENAED